MRRSSSVSDIGRDARLRIIVDPQPSTNAFTTPLAPPVSSVTGPAGARLNQASRRSATSSISRPIEVSSFSTA
jgi:hypothetical protein